MKDVTLTSKEVCALHELTVLCFCHKWSRVEVECRLHECMWMCVLWPCLNGRWTNWSGGRQLLNRSRNMLCSITGTWFAHPFSYLAWPLSLHCWIKWYSIAISGCVRVHWLAVACFAHVDVVLVSLINTRKLEGK